MSITPKIYIEFVADGAESVTGAIGEVSEGLDDVTEAGDKAAKALEGTGKASEGATGRGRRLWETLKANAGAAQGAAGAFASVSAILNSDMSPAAKVATGISQGLATGLAAFGPIGQLAGAAVSFLSSSLIPLIDGMTEAEEEAKSLSDQWREGGEQASFYATSIGKMAATLQDANAAAAHYARQLARATDETYKLFTGTETLARARSVAVLEEQETALKTMGEAQRRFLEQGEEAQAAFDSVFGAGTAQRLLAQSTEDQLLLQNKVEFNEQWLSLEEARRKAELEGNQGGGGGGGAAARAMTDHEVYLKINALRIEAEIATEEKISQVRDYFAQRRQAAEDARAARLLALSEARAETNARILSIQAEQEKKAAEEIQAEWDATFGGMGMMLEGFASGMAQAAAASLLFGESFGEAAKGALKALAVQAGGEALMEGARALAKLAAWLATPWNANLLASAKTHALAAAGFAAIAGGAAIGSNAIGGAAAGGAGDATGGRGPSPRELGAPSQGAQQGPTVINVNDVANGPMSRVIAREFRAGNEAFRRRAATGAAA